MLSDNCYSYVFWMGDLNFRLTGDIPPEEIGKMIHKNELTDLIARDELTIAIKTGKAFETLKEGSLTFPPTYKYLVGEGTSSSFDYKLVV